MGPTEAITHTRIVLVQGAIGSGAALRRRFGDYARAPRSKNAKEECGPDSVSGPKGNKAGTKDERARQWKCETVPAAIWQAPDGTGGQKNQCARRPGMRSCWSMPTTKNPISRGWPSAGYLVRA